MQLAKLYRGHINRMCRTISGTLVVLALGLALEALSVHESTGSGCTSHSISKTALETARLTMPLIVQQTTVLQRPLPHDLRPESHRRRRCKSGSVLFLGCMPVLKVTSQAAANELAAQRPADLLLQNTTHVHSLLFPESFNKP